MDSTQFLTDLLMSNAPDRIFTCLNRLEQLEQLNKTFISYLIPMQKCHFNFEFKNLDRLLVHANRIEIEIAKP